MAVKLDRPADYGADGVVVYVAKSIEEVDKAREGLLAAEIPVDLPEAAVEALFASGRESLPIRVSAKDYKRSLDVIDELFPPPEVELPPLEPEAPAAEARAAAPGEAEAAGESGRQGPELTDVGEHDGVGTRRAGPSLDKLRGSLVKLIFIAVASLLLPLLGLLLSGFALYSAWWCHRALDRVSGGHTAQGRAKIVMGLSGAAILWNVGLALFLAYRQGWIRL
jgi:hypothetical protein